MVALAELNLAEGIEHAVFIVLDGRRAVDNELSAVRLLDFADGEGKGLRSARRDIERSGGTNRVRIVGTQPGDTVIELLVTKAVRISLKPAAHLKIVNTICLAKVGSIYRLPYNLDA